MTFLCVHILPIPEDTSTSRMCGIHRLQNNDPGIRLCLVLCWSYSPFSSAYSPPEGPIGERQVLCCRSHQHAAPILDII